MKNQAGERFFFQKFSSITGRVKVRALCPTLAKARLSRQPAVENPRQCTESSKKLGVTG